MTKWMSTQVNLPSPCTCLKDSIWEVHRFCTIPVFFFFSERIWVLKIQTGKYLYILLCIKPPFCPSSSSSLDTSCTPQKKVINVLEIKEQYKIPIYLNWPAHLQRHWKSKVNHWAHLAFFLGVLKGAAVVAGWSFFLCQPVPAAWLPYDPGRHFTRGVLWFLLLFLLVLTAKVACMSRSTELCYLHL